jgi:hypothetical protein
MSRGDETGPVPIALVAVTVMRYQVAVVSPVTVVLVLVEVSPAHPEHAGLGVSV